MSIVFEVIKDTKFLSLCWKDKESADYILDNINIGIKAVLPGKKITVEYSQEDATDSRLTDDFPCLSSYIPVFSERVVNSSRNILEKCGQLIPIWGEDKVFYMLNVTHFEDIIDYANSHLVFDDGVLIDIRFLKLKPFDDNKNMLFKLKGDPRGPIFATQSFKEMFESNNFVGIKFKPIE